MRHILSVRNLLAFTILSLVVLLTLWVFRSYKGSREEDVVVIPPQVDLALKGFNYTETVSGRRQWTLKGDRALHDMESASTKIFNLVMVLYDEELGEFSLRAREGDIDTEHRTLNARGDVVVENLPRYKISTESLCFFSKEKIFETNDMVEISSDEMGLSGRGMRFNVRTRELEIFSSVKASFYSLNKNSH